MPNQVQIPAALAVALVQSGTLAFTYPAGFNKGDFTTYNAELVTGSNDRFTVDNGDFTVSLGNTTATITFQAATSIPAGTSVILGLDAAGAEPYKDQADSKVTIKDAVVKTLLRVNLGNPATASSNGIASALVATSTAKSYTLADCVTAFKTAGGFLDVPRNVYLTGSASSDHVVTITGKDIYNQVMIENITLNSTTPVYGLKAFNQITNINVAAGAASKTVDVGFYNALGLPVFLKSWDNIHRQTVDAEVIATNNKIRVDIAPAIVAINAGTSQYNVSPVYGFIAKCSLAICAAFTTGGAVTVNIATVPVVGLSVPVSTGAAGTVYTDTSTAEFGATGEIAKDASFELAFASALDSVGNFAGFVEITPGGLVVAGVETVPTATTGDVRGTWTPPTALTCNGSRTYILDLLVNDPGYIGIQQYGT